MIVNHLCNLNLDEIGMVFGGDRGCECWCAAIIRTQNSCLQTIFIVQDRECFGYVSGSEICKFICEQNYLEYDDCYYRQFNDTYSNSI